MRESWAPHGAPGWYISAADHHYRCYQVYISETGAERTVDTLEWFPYHVPMPQTNSANKAAAAARRDLIHALQHPAPASPFAGLDPNQLSALQDLAQIFDSTADLRVSRAAPPRVDAATISQTRSPVPLPASYNQATLDPRQRRRRAQQTASLPTQLPSPPSPLAPPDHPSPSAPLPHQHDTRFRRQQAAVTHVVKPPIIPTANAVLNPVTGASLS
jgi:hypothetical protein